LAGQGTIPAGDIRQCHLGEILHASGLEAMNIDDEIGRLLR
jgi:hypothetical protein